MSRNELFFFEGKGVRDISCKGKEEKEIKGDFMPTIFH